MTENEQPHQIALVTGANKGIGQETVRGLAALGWTVWMGTRDLERGRAAAAQASGDVRTIALDVTDDMTVQAAVSTVREGSGRLDVLINNAGIGGSFKAAEDTVASDFLPVFGANVLGPVRVTQAFLPLLRQSSQPRIVMVSSGMGSFGVTTNPERFESTLKSLVYSSSKAALNMITTQYAKSLEGFQVTAVDPGYTATDLNGHRGTQTVEQGAEVVVQAATLAADAPTGTFSNAAGPLPW